MGQWFQKSLPALRERFLRQFPYPVTFFYSPLPGVERDIAEVRKLLHGFTVDAVPVELFEREAFYEPLRSNFSFLSNECLVHKKFKRARGYCAHMFAFKQMNY